MPSRLRLTRTSKVCLRSCLRGLCMLVMAGVALACSPDELPERSVVEARLLLAFDRTDEVDVIVGFEDPQPHRRWGDLDGHRLAIHERGRALLAASAGGFIPNRQFDHIPAVAGRISRSALAALSRMPGVSFIQLDGPGHGALTVSVPAIGADVAKADFKVTGKGVRVAVLDTGANTSHADLKSSIVSPQHCFTRNACPPGNTAEGTSAEDDHGHGSHVTGIITSDGVVAGVGFAPDAEIVAVKITDRANAGFVSDWAAGLDWLFSNLATLKVKVINASIDTNQTYGSAAECDRGEPALARAVKNLVEANVVIFGSSGNLGLTTQMAAPACLTGVIAVGATYKSNQGRQPASGTYAGQWGNTFGDCADQTTAFDQVTCFTNSGPRLDIVAPGAVIVSDTLNGRTEGYRGTSQASPTAAGIAALMLECDPTLTPVQIKDILIRTGVAVTDPKNGSSYPSLRASAAVREACAGRTGPDAGTDAGPRDTAVDDGSTLRQDGGSGGTGGRGGSGGMAGSGGATSSAGGRTGSGGFATGGGAGTSSGGATAGAGGSAGSSGGSVGGAGAGGLFATGGRSATGGAAPAAGGGTAGTRSGLPPNTGGQSTATGGATSPGTAKGKGDAGCGCRMGRPAGETGWPALVLLGALLVPAGAARWRSAQPRRRHVGGSGSNRRQTRRLSRRRGRAAPAPRRRPGLGPSTAWKARSGPS